MFCPENTKIFSEGCPSFIEWMELGFSIVRGWEFLGVPPSCSWFTELKWLLLSVLYMKGGTSLL